MKAAGKLRYVGITTSEGRRHDEFEQIMRAHPLDFVQLTYNVVDREAEARLLPLARERGIAVIVNRPFRQGALTQRLEGEQLPDWVAEIGRVELGAVHPEVHRLASGRHLRHPGHHPRRSCAREHGGRAGHAAGRAMRERMAAMSAISDVGMVDLSACQISCSSRRASTGACSNCRTTCCGRCISSRLPPDL